MPIRISPKQNDSTPPGSYDCTKRFERPVSNLKELHSGPRLDQMAAQWAADLPPVPIGLVEEMWWPGSLIDEVRQALGDRQAVDPGHHVLRRDLRQAARVRPEQVVHPIPVRPDPAHQVRPGQHGQRLLGRAHVATDARACRASSTGQRGRGVPVEVGPGVAAGPHSARS